MFDNLFTSDKERLEAERLMEEIKQKPLQAQWDVNLANAQHENWFVAGGRPAIIWVCAISLGMYFIPQYGMGAFLWGKACWIKGEVVAYPLDAQGLLELTLSMLGMSGLRTLEKFKGVAR